MAERITIKSQTQLDKMRVAGRLVGETLNLLEKLVEPGITTYELNHEAEAFIRKNGGIPSFLNYNGYPASICTSVNEQVVHGIPSKKVKLKDGDIISIDCGAIVDGWHGDAARTFSVGSIAPEVQKLIDVTRECFFLGAEQAVEGNHLVDIARAVEAHAKEHGFETLVLSHDGKRVDAIPPRRASFAAQAPQSFRLGDILALHARIRARPEGYTDMVDQATICFTLGVDVHLVEGCRGNVKVTTPEDMVTLAALLAWRARRG